MRPRFFVHWKSAFPDALLLFEMESNYACFHGDAVAAAEVLGIGLGTVVYEAERIPTAVIPRGSRDRHVERLEMAGHRVIVCAATAKVGPRRRVA